MIGFDLNTNALVSNWIELLLGKLLVNFKFQLAFMLLIQNNHLGHGKAFYKDYKEINMINGLGNSNG